ncbi:hypothetical protein F5H01DRAFT_153071 [Linnemannia elongata]|nr:hypothetical protein F5H01DRAFT_153071 [Linnemannia elongata]
MVPWPLVFNLILGKATTSYVAVVVRLPGTDPCLIAHFSLTVHSLNLQPLFELDIRIGNNHQPPLLLQGITELDGSLTQTTGSTVHGSFSIAVLLCSI